VTEVIVVAPATTVASRITFPVAGKADVEAESVPPSVR
jgi:hypothetical protein